MNSIDEIIDNYVKLIVSAQEIDKDASLEEYGLNSIDFIKLVIALEMEFNFEVDDDYLLISKLNTKAKIKKLIESVKKNGLQ